jgi:hypothetical protein
MRFMLSVLLCLFTLTAATVEERTKGLEHLSGFIHLYWDAKTGKMLLRIDQLNQEMLYLSSLPAGVGSNDIGLDRGQLGQERVVRFERSGNRVLLMQQNYDFRAGSADAGERQAVADSFARSAIAGFTVEAESDGQVLVDATSFFLRDAHNVTSRLREANQGAFRMDPQRSAFYLERTKSFPRNTEIEVTLTFAGENPGGFLRSVVPDAESITVRQHHSFIALPEPGYEPRDFDPRAGYFMTAYADYSTPVTEKVRRRFITRHRLQKNAAGETLKPIVYYLDRGTPEPVRSALLDGGNWWNAAFEAAGFRNAFRVEMLPEGADPMDVRYNLIQWVHRSTRGWSYGASVADPRTGEILKGHVTLGSLRVRQDYLIAEGLLAPHDGTAKPKEALELALARLRQLSAHEIGHTLGLAHNFAASVSNRASVMDYPHPFVALKPDGSLDTAGAYATGIGEWDKTAIRYGYAEAPPAALAKVLEESQKRGVLFIGDADAGDGGAHPSTSVWDNGADSVEELGRIMRLRARGLERFGEKNIRAGEPFATLEEVLVPLYLGHRYQVTAAAKWLGGLHYTYALRGDGQTIAAIVPAAKQNQALNALLDTLQPAALLLPENVLKLIPPRPIGYPRTRETFTGRTGLTFDPLGAAEAAVHHTVGLILHPDRVARIVQYHARDAANPSLDAVIDALLKRTWQQPSRPGMEGEVRRVTDLVVGYHLMALASNEKAAPQARAVALEKLTVLESWASKTVAGDAAQRAHQGFASAMIKSFLKEPTKPTLPRPSEPPPGAPI